MWRLHVSLWLCRCAPCIPNGLWKENKNVELLKHSICIEVKVICIHVNIKYLPKFLGGLTRLLACLVEKLTCSHPGEIKKTKDHVDNYDNM